MVFDGTDKEEIQGRLDREEVQFHWISHLENNFKMCMFLLAL